MPAECAADWGHDVISTRETGTLRHAVDPQGASKVVTLRYDLRTSTHRDTRKTRIRRIVGPVASSRSPLAGSATTPSPRLYYVRRRDSWLGETHHQGTWPVFMED